MLFVTPALYKLFKSTCALTSIVPGKFFKTKAVYEWLLYRANKAWFIKIVLLKLHIWLQLLFLDCQQLNKHLIDFIDKINSCHST
jgi:hypothetical protein